MRFSICVMADVDEIGFFSHAETLGYDSVWVTDSQMLFSDCYAVLALAARQTTRLRLGPGTAICGTRIPPVHVAAMATLNRLAPGRVHLGIGTGNTAMRTMGQRPMRIAEYDEYLRALANVALLEPGEPVDSPRVVRTAGPNVMASVFRNPASDLEALLRARGGDAICATCLVGTA